jgi:hypothetical protein
MNNFDLKKFLVENKLTTASKNIKEATPGPGLSRLGNRPTIAPASRLEPNVLSVQAALSKAGITPDQQIELDSAEGYYHPQFKENTPYSYEEVVKILSDLIREYEEEAAQGVQPGGIQFPDMLPFWDFDAEDYHRPGPLSLALPEVDDIVIIPVGFEMNENEDVTVSGQEPTRNEASKYLKHDSAQAILSELDNELALAELEIKKDQIQKIVQEIENKISTLEEDAGMQGFVDKAAINGKRKIVKELNREYEKVNRIYEKMHAKFNKKNKKKNLNEVDDMGSSPSYNAKTENVITFLSFKNGLEFTIGDVDEQDTGVLVGIMKFDNGFQLNYASDSGEGYGRYYDFNGNEVEEDDVF